MRDTINGIILVGMLALGMFAFYMVGEMRQDVAVATPEPVIERSVEEEVATTEAEAIEAQLLAERAEKEEDKTTWFAAE